MLDCTSSRDAHWSENRYVCTNMSLKSLLTTDVTKSVDTCNHRTVPGDTIDVHYEGLLEDGTVFDSSFKRSVPLTFELGVGQVIKGWDEGMKNMCVGEKRTLTIPPSMAYGSRGVGPIPGDATLSMLTTIFFRNLLTPVFHVELMNVHGTTKDEL